MRTGRSRRCARPSQNGPSSAHGPTAPVPAVRTARPKRPLQCARLQSSRACAVWEPWRPASFPFGTRSRRARGMGEVPGGRRPPRQSADPRVRASHMRPAQNPRSREDVRRRPCTRATRGGDPVARVQGKWLRFCKTPVRNELFKPVSHTCDKGKRSCRTCAKRMIQTLQNPSSEQQISNQSRMRAPNPPANRPTRANPRPPCTRRCREGHGSAPPGSQRGPSAWLSLAASPKLIRRGLVISANQC